MDNLLTGRLANIEDLFGHERFRFVKHDVTSFIHVPGPLDAVLHFASPASPVDFERLPIQILKVGALGTHNALGVAKEKGARFLLASTSECYGDPEVNPQPETYWGNVNPVGIRGVYDEAKRFAEAMSMAYHRYHGVQVRIVRIFNTYGPGMRPDDGRMIPAFFTQALRGEDLTVFGDGQQTRSINYVSDLVEGHRAPARERLRRAREHRQSGGDDGARGRAAHRGDRRRALQSGAPRSAARRSEGAAPRHHARAQGARLAAQGDSGRGSARDAAVLQGRARA